MKDAVIFAFGTSLPRLYNVSYNWKQAVRAQMIDDASRGLGLGSCHLDRILKLQSHTESSRCPACWYEATAMKV